MYPEPSINRKADDTSWLAWIGSIFTGGSSAKSQPGSARPESPDLDPGSDDSGGGDMGGGDGGSGGD